MEHLSGVTSNVQTQINSINSDLIYSKKTITWLSDTGFTMPGNNILFANKYSATITITVRSNTTISDWTKIGTIPVTSKMTVYLNDALNYSSINIRIVNDGIYARNPYGTDTTVCGTLTFPIY